LKRQNSNEPSEFLPVQKHIAAIDEEISRLLYGLKGTFFNNLGNDYRRSIAETVMKDFSFELSGLRDNIKTAKENYIEGLGVVEPDRARIECIR
jgi:hypothetical protein